MSFWSALFGRGRDSSSALAAEARKEPASRPTVPVASTTTLDAGPAIPKTRHSRPLGIQEAGWFTALEIEQLRGIRDENLLARRLAAVRPDMSREDVLFRHLLSSAVAQGDFEVPLLPQSSTRIMQLNREPKASIRDYVKAIESDTQLVRAILDTANSTIYASVAGNATLDQSIVRMGVAMVEQIALAHTLSARLFKVPGHEETLEALTKHNLVAAVAAQGMAARVDISPGSAFLGGLFHDSGKLVLLSIVAQVQRRLGWKASPTLIDSAFDAFHVSMGRLACQRWKLPEDIFLAVERHHGPPETVTRPLDKAVYLGNLMAHRLAGKERGQDTVWEEDPVVARVFPAGETETLLSTGLRSPSVLLAGLDTTYRNL